MASALAFLQGAVDAVDRATYTYAGLNFGTAAVDRYLVACVTYRVGSAIGISSVTIGGVAATLVIGASSGTAPTVTRAAIYIALVPTGTSGNVVVTHSGTVSRAGCSLYSLTGIGSATASATSTMTNLAGGTFGSFTLPNASHVIACGYNGDGSSRISTASANLSAGSPTLTATSGASDTTWSGLTEDYDTMMEATAVASSAWVVASWDSVGSGGTAYTLVADTGAFTLSGTATSLTAARKLVAASASFSLTGTAASLVAARTLVAATTSFTLTGTATTLKSARTLTASSASFTFTGTDAALTYTGDLPDYTLTASSGAFVLTGGAATFTLRSFTYRGASRSAASNNPSRSVSSSAPSRTVTGSR